VLPLHFFLSDEKKRGRKPKLGKMQREKMLACVLSAKRGAGGMPLKGEGHCPGHTLNPRQILNQTPLPQSDPKSTSSFLTSWREPAG